MDPVLEISGMKCYQCNTGTTDISRLDEFFALHQGHIGLWWRVEKVLRHSDAYLGQIGTEYATE
jgi:hypothetical protein